MRAARPNPRTFRKPLPPDCLLDGQLHPNIRERLARVRELPMTSVATLHGVERDETQPYLVWDFLDGTPLVDHLSTIPDDDVRQRESDRALTELTRVLQTMHGFGIVHGAIHDRNVIVAPDGTIKLTHVSPLLYYDENVDLSAVDALRAKYVRSRDDNPNPRAVRGRISPMRWRPLVLLGAAAMVACGLALALTLITHVRAQQPQPLDPPVAQPASAR
jgi:hypothetical protein